MSRNSKNSSKSEAKSKGLDKPFKESIVRKAKKLVADYRIILERNERLGFIGSAVVSGRGGTESRDLSRFGTLIAARMRITAALPVSPIASRPQPQRGSTFSTGRTGGFMLAGAGSTSQRCNVDETL